MNRAVLAVLISMACGAHASAEWQKAYEGYGVTGFARAGAAVWALPGLATSTDAGRTWGSIEEQAGLVDDADAAPDGRVLAVSRGDLSIEDSRGEELVPEDAPRPSASTARFIGSAVLAAGEMGEGDHEGDSLFLSQDDGRSWKRVLDRKAGSRSPIFVLDGKRAWLASTSGGFTTVWRSEDGGRSWKDSPPLYDEAVDLTFIDKKRGWIAARSPNWAGRRIYATEDGGKSWSDRGMVALSTGAFASLAFVDDHRGWAAGPGALWRTEDGGRTWLADEAPEDGPSLVAAALLVVEEGRRRTLLFGVMRQDQDDQSPRGVRTAGAVYRRELSP